ncbi:hypothetical protein GPROT1_01479 [Gammaproteobacteria bacterium]|nr:hypothetical protein GPROT1_01479 [Gammaproteobacteria bacterium]
MYCGIDALAFLNMPPEAERVRADDFITWVDRYLVFRDGLKISGIELYAARCAMVHTYTVEAILHRTGKVQRKIGYMDEALPEIQGAADVRSLVLVSVRGLVDAFGAGVQAFLKELAKDDARRKTAANRLLEMVHEFPVSGQK